jgi:hypothetical protein
VTTIPQPATEPDAFESDDWVGENPGDAIAGIVIAREMVTIRRTGEEAVVLVIRCEDGVEKRVPCFRTHLKELLAKHDPQPGDGIAITYFGQPDGFKHQYAMRVAKNGAGDEPDTDDPPF